MNQHLHIVCLDVPFPVDYGGVVDLFYKIRSLHQEGVQIHLHCFEYGRGKAQELDQYCAEVRYYSRNRGHKGLSHNLPYIVCSRCSSELAERLLQDEHPVLLEGIHCSGLLLDPRFEKRKVILRLHNVECLYYRQLYRTSTSIFRKWYFWYESRILRRFEKRIAGQVQILAVSREDVRFYQEQFEAPRIAWLPVFVPSAKVSSQEGTGCFCLYHGNLSVAENQWAVSWLIRHVFNDLSFPLVIAGKAPSSQLRKLIDRHQHSCLVADPSEAEMQDMIAKAQVHVLPSFNCTGIKMKLLNALFNGRHCVVNPAAVNDTGWDSVCHVGNSPAAFKKSIEALYHRPFSSEEVGRRQELLGAQFNNEENARQLIRWLW